MPYKMLVRWKDGRIKRQEIVTWHKKPRGKTFNLGEGVRARIVKGKYVPKKPWWKF